MAKYDHGGGCACGLYKECEPGCESYKGKELPQKRNKIVDSFLTGYDEDFGFTFQDDAENDKLKIDHSQLTKNHKKLSDSLFEMYNAILPLLKNLKKNPEKDTIKWPNRIKVIEDFEKKLMVIYENAPK